MINDYKFRNEFLTPSAQQSRRRLGHLAVIGLIVGASGLYAALGSFEKAPQTTAVELDRTSAPTAAEQTAQPLAQVPLILPGQSRDGKKLTEAPAVAVASVSKREETAPALAAPATPSGTPELNLPKHKALEISELGADVASTAPATGDEATPDASTPAEDQEVLVSMDHGTWQEERVKPGDSLALIFSRLKLSPNLLHRIVNSSKEAKTLANIRPGEAIKVRIDQQGDLLELVHKQSEIRSLQILPTDESFAAQINDRSLEKRIASAAGTITSSLYMGAQRAGLSDALTMELANIFGWDIDFALEIRAGDQFSLIYEEEYLDGKKYRNGPILAAEFVNQGKVFRAIRFEDDEGYSSYYSPEGESMRKAFLRAPVDFRRISSRFTKARYHPVLGKKRPHMGVDYAAATGTPIKASGDGRVIFRGTKGGYGRTVMIKHGSQYTTLYAHMSKFRGNVNNGSRVRQGQVIGYVGQSGLATGPHLHYEFRVNGVHRNPLTIKLPAAEPLAKDHRAKFAQISSQLLAELDLIAKTMVADAR
ncbi:OapA family protein [Sedimenticola hydrogenitrophicus]|uniref:OapA family protein n=1 Tax=Sedimenticola hydrogenitrophicus TaxID=2967975 RepID=UPI0023B04EDF|nr:peptidoglycan DD-metalloendopeptidase family protein [Sedimenticola hydrogenitrophicus]